MQAWLKKHKTSHFIGIINFLVVLAATVVEFVTINNSALFSKLASILDLVHLVNYPVYWVAENIPDALLGPNVAAVVLALILFAVGGYAWPFSLCLLFRLDSLEIRKKAAQSEAAQPRD